MKHPLVFSLVTFVFSPKRRQSSLSQVEVWPSSHLKSSDFFPPQQDSLASVCLCNFIFLFSSHSKLLKFLGHPVCSLFLVLNTLDSTYNVSPAFLCSETGFRCHLAQACFLPPSCAAPGLCWVPLLVRWDCA